ncbi:nucleotidyltransferase domain-containing protein [Magnetovirga frankeli]|uniref:nucleotidyltransferase domain-containing protein n=1 Tax=Magnetovirga frankeli TaxID=947516 RepID=UPI0012931A96|nr:nucleotidyltransferase domain-containing protein [gamma proteobacterium SS-5]
MNIDDTIQQRLTAIERERDVRILYACESGSRAWGFASPDSDYDVRFIYVQRRDWYLAYNIERKRDVIELPIVDAIDCNGWDLRKALYLFARTNGALLEWLNSPIRYREQGLTAETLRQLAPTVCNATALCYHYSHMARGNARDYLFGQQVRLKKYFYVLRPLLAIRYIQQTGTPPPTEFQALVDAVAPDSLLPSIQALLEQKRQSVELGRGEAIPAIDRFIRAELDEQDDRFTGQGRPTLTGSAVDESLNRIFRHAITEFEED